MTSAEYRNLHAKPTPAASKAPGKGKTKANTFDAPTAAQIEARAELAKVGRYKGHYEAQPARRYVLRNDAEAAALDAAFYTITGTEPT